MKNMTVKELLMDYYAYEMKRRLENFNTVTSHYTVAELKREAKRHGIKTANMNKAELITAINGAFDKKFGNAPLSVLLEEWLSYGGELDGLTTKFFLEHPATENIKLTSVWDIHELFTLLGDSVVIESLGDTLYNVTLIVKTNTYTKRHFQNVQFQYMKKENSIYRDVNKSQLTTIRDVIRYAYITLQK